ncbi:GxxExxY protein [Paucibacter oligotrophus]|uniref:GxxExxY protein n=1 Tax=Roseateles oligotrophus TaxID=1769250 RepID=A0A840L8I4_9BURK|nr:GxxExxY protein [Roseateles oligotrophus]MBB4843025.1 GxxExxY protein [Roseateles oligotrophus]
MGSNQCNHRGTEAQSFDVSELTIGAAIEVHRELGPGLLEAAYEAALCAEFALRGIQFRRQIEMPIVYKGVPLAQSYRVDLIVEESLVLELKAVERLEAVHTAQLLTYLKLLNLPTGLLINFNCAQLRQGLKRVAL